MKILNKFIWSKKEPSNKNDIWFDGSTWKIYTEEAWQSFTLPVDAADKVAKMLENASEAYQEKLIAGEGIIIEDNEINLTLKTVNGESIIGEGNIVIEGGTSNGVESEEVASTIPTPEFPYVTKSELTELSAEVSGLSERVDALGEGGGAFEVIYKQTTYEEIVEAFNAGKYVYCVQNSIVHPLTVLNDAAAFFEITVATTGYRIVCQSTGVWYTSNFNFTHSLETLENGNAKITIAGKTAEVATPQYVENAIQQSGGGGGMTTPSGDPMHYMFEAVGATYNATDADIPMVGIYGDSYVHKAKHWHLNELGDITNEEMRVIYNERYPIPSAKYIPEWFRDAKARTTLSALSQSVAINLTNMCRAAQCETFALLGGDAEIQMSQLNEAFYDCAKLRKILNVFNFYSVTSISAPFGRCIELEHLRIRQLKINMDFKYNEKISKFSILYMIENGIATSAITIRLSNALYDSYMADAEIQAALAAHPNVSLAK